jgi:hypothetical protein
MGIGSDDNLENTTQPADNNAAVSDAGAEPRVADSGVRFLGVARGHDSERNEALLLALRAYIERNNLSDRLTAIPLNAVKYELRTSGVILAFCQNVKGKAGVFYSVLYTESQDIVGYTQTRPVFVEPGAPPMQIDMPVTMFDVTNKVARAAAKKCVMAHFPDANVFVQASEFPILTIAMVGGKDADQNTIQEIVFNCGDAIDAKLCEATGRSKAHAIALVNDLKGRTVSLKTETNPNPVVDVNGAPVRADLSFSLTSRETNASREQAIHDHPKPVSRADVFINPQWNPQPRPQQNQAFIPGMPQQPATTWYVPEVHITNIQPQGDTNSMEEIILALVATTTISDNPQPLLAAAFQPRKTQDVVNLRNLGGIGIDLPYLNPETKPGEQPKPFVLDTAAPEFLNNPAELLRLIDENISPMPMYVLHVAESGELSYRMRAFLETLQDGETGLRARQEIIDALDNLSGGKFSQKWDNTTAMVQHAGYRLPVGYYTADNGGMIYDTRRIDSLALKNLGGANNTDMVEEWNDAQYNQNLTAEQREVKMLRVLRQVCSASLRITGRDHILNLNWAFLKAAREALLEGGKVKLSLASNLASQNDPRARGMASVGSFVGTFDSPIAQFNGGYTAGPGAGPMDIGSRWG